MTLAIRFDLDSENRAERVADLVRMLAPCIRCSPVSQPSHHPRYTHMGAILADTALQAGLCYATVVQPRVERVLGSFPGATSISELRKVLLSTSASAFLNWTHPEKVARFVGLVELCALSSIDTVSDFQRWVVTEIAATALRSVRGIGPKSVDYLRMLAGHRAIPMDRHLFRLVAMAGVDTTNYRTAQRAFTEGCVRAGLDPSSAEQGLWRLMRDLRF